MATATVARPASPRNRLADHARALGRECRLFVLGVAVIEAVHYATKVGSSGDDYTGLLAIPAALLLLGLGAVTLWTTRRTSGNRPWRYLRRALVGATGVAVALVVIAPLSAGYLFTHLGRAVVPEPNIGAHFEEVSFTTADGLKLAG